MRWRKEDLYEKGREWLMKQYPHGQVGDVMSVRDRPEIKLKIVDIRAIRLFYVDGNTWGKDGVVYRPFIGGHNQSYYHWQRFYEGTEYEWQRNPWVWIIEFELEKKGQEDE